MQKIFFSLIVLITIPLLLEAQQKRQTENLVIVTLDGLRWQEVFNGADDILLANKKFTRDSANMRTRYWHENVQQRRKKLFPFLWSEIESKGQLYGNRAYSNFVNVANPYWFSYPGYNEMFTGYADDSINTNNKVWNPNVNVLEHINNQKNYKGKVAAFSTWDVFPYILNTQRSGIYVNADVDTLEFKEDKFQLINDWQFLTTRPVGVRPDVITYIAAREYMKTYKPKVLYIAFDETDDFAHGGMYDQYLQSANAEDKMIADLWNYIQSTPQYKNKTTLFITCDHGRGDKVKEDWQHHGKKIEGADEIWFAIIGPDTKWLGEIKEPCQLYQKQFAASFAAMLGMQFKPAPTTAEPIGLTLLY
jgi:hypothetical protein